MPIQKILVVDDSATERFFMTDLLTKQGYTVSTAENGDEGIKKAKAEQPDLILMDVVMPGLNGFQATRMLTRDETTKNIPVIMCTSKDQETDKIWGMRQGALDYLCKPIVPEELLEKIAHVAAAA
jgi:twitching motility two-component system response regulator PilH